MDRTYAVAALRAKRFPGFCVLHETIWFCPIKFVRTAHL